MHKTVPSHKKMLAINQALVLGSVRQHKLTEVAQNLNVQLQAEIEARKRAEAQHRMNVLTVSNRKLKHEIVRRQAVEKSLKKSEQHQQKLLEQSCHMQEQLRNLSHQVLQAQEEERKRISRELHDVIAQNLTGINVRLAALARQALANTKGLDRNIARTQRLVEKSVDIVHNFARELRPAVLDDLGLIPALHSFMKNFAARTGVHTRLTAFAGVEQLDPARRTVLFRVAQEALTNVARHAKASRAEVNIHKLRGCLCMKITDDGKSFSVEGALHANGGERLGLLGMRERLEMVGGHFGIESAPGKGTTITAHLPFGKNGRGIVNKKTR
jgi:signal transduction histidine kinase